MTNESGEILNDRYQIQEVLGEGALGRTMLGLDTQTGATVAVKELLPSRMKRWKDLDLFHRECRTLQALSHPGIPSYFDDFVIEPTDEETPPRLFLVQEFIAGRSLQDHLDDGREFDESEVRDILRQTLDILGYIHGLNPQVIHRDIKPANMMLRPDNTVALIDFGAVREAVTLDGVGSTIVGTFGYMPPEQYAGRSEPATDLFALGATCVQLVSGRPPGELFEGLHQFHLPDDLPVTVGFERILLRLTEPEIGGRYASVDQVLEDLDTGFLMVSKEMVLGSLPIPYEIRPAPRPFPGFYLRDAYHGSSHLANFLAAVFSAALTLIFPLAAIVMNQPAFFVIGAFAFLVALGMAAAVTQKARTEIGVFQNGTYTLGEITGVFWSTSNVSMTNLTYRYRVGEGFENGAVATVDAAYAQLAPGDPVGVLYLPDEPTEHVLYAVPQTWASKQTVGIGKRLKSEA